MPSAAQEPDRLARAIGRVTRNENCSGCGGCTLISPRVKMQPNSAGFLRPVVTQATTPTANAQSKAEARNFTAMCPGVAVRAPAPPKALRHEAFGPYYSAWAAAAIDPQVRHAGSSGGVLTALTTWLIATGQVTTMTGASGDPASPSRTVAVTISTRDEALAAAGSRYAPVATLTGWVDQPLAGLVAKPCEIAAAVRLHNSSGTTAAMPITLSFFCAGTPSQRATDQLVESLGVPANELSDLRYRGQGWPGRFTATTRTGDRASLSYEKSWGTHLGRQLQFSCKICVDGTGAQADIAVGDLWEADARGYPVFDDNAGNSVAIARTKRGHAILLAAAAAGVITISPVSLEQVAAIQPYQVQRRATLLGRLLGRRLAGKPVPRYRGYGLAMLALKNPYGNARALAGTFLRSIRSR
jgi:coenzyme F420 hydrogenase subunit beta